MFINDSGMKVIEELATRIIDGYGEENDITAADGYALASVLKYIIESLKPEE